MFNKILSLFYSIFIGYFEYLFAWKKYFLSQLKLSMEWKNWTCGYLCSIKHLVRSIKYFIEHMEYIASKKDFLKSIKVFVGLNKLNLRSIKY